jgi:hypothetical protein
MQKLTIYNTYYLASQHTKLFKVTTLIEIYYFVTCRSGFFLFAPVCMFFTGNLFKNFAHSYISLMPLVIGNQILLYAELSFLT